MSNHISERILNAPQLACPQVCSPPSLPHSAELAPPSLDMCGHMCGHVFGNVFGHVFRQVRCLAQTCLQHRCRKLIMVTCPLPPLNNTENHGRLVLVLHQSLQTVHFGNRGLYHQILWLQNELKFEAQKKEPRLVFSIKMRESLAFL